MIAKEPEEQAKVNDTVDETAAKNKKSDTPVKRSGQIDFSKLTMWQQDSTDSTPDLNNESTPIVKQKVSSEGEPVKEEKSASIMLGANKEETEQQKQPQIQLDKLSIPKAVVPKQEKKLKLWASGIGLEMYGRRFEVSYRRVFLTSFFVICIFSLLSIFLWSYSKYIQVSTDPIVNPIYKPLVEKYDEYEQKFSKYLRFSHYEDYLNIKIYGTHTEQNLEKIVSAENINYIYKKNIIQKNLDNLTQAIFDQSQKLNTLKQKISKFGFLSEDLYTLLKSQKQIQPIKDSLLSLEVIKFSSAIRVFSYLDTFLEGFASVVKVPKSDVAKYLQSIIERWENDIYVYLNDCYLNPFERDYNCDAIGDFDLYYDLIQKDTSFNKEYFKKLIKYIDLKLEQTEIPSFSIVFRRFDPTKDQITFSIDVNTFQKDEIALLQKNILNPHVFVVTQLLNLLKESIFIVGESIDIKKLDVENKVVQIGSQQFNIKNSQMTFSLPIQKSTQREISDFVENIDNQYQWPKALQITKDMHQIDTTHGSADSISGNTVLDRNTGSSADLNTDVNTDLNTQEMTNNNITYTFSEDYARKLLTLQKENARIKYLLQEKWEALVVKERASQIELLQYVDWFTQEEIKSVFDYIIKTNLLDSVVIDVSLLRQKNDKWETLFEVLRNNQLQEIKDKSEKEVAEKESLSQEATENKTWFAQVRDFFSSWTNK